MTRRASSIIVKVTATYDDDVERVSYYGPFQKDVGPAAMEFIDKLEKELEEKENVLDWKVSVEWVFIGEDESDCEVRTIE